jgi:putative cardiolipin synthase
MLPVGIDGLASRLELIEAAEAALDLQYYIFRGDESGTLIADALLRAADRGVRVRVLVDDGESISGDEKIFAMSAHPLIEIRVFNPFDYRGHIRIIRAADFLLHKHRLDHRMHNKLMVVDNALALIGGRNIGDQYFQIDPDSQFGDDDLAVYGPMVQRLSTVFDEFWNSPLAIPVAALDRKHSSPNALSSFRAAVADAKQQSRFQSDLRRRVATGEPLAGIISGHSPLTWATAELVYDSPGKGNLFEGAAPGKPVYPAVESRARDVHDELLMVTPYFVPPPAEVALLKSERDRKVRVRLLTNSLETAPDVMAHAGYTHYRRTLLEDGVEIHEIRALPESPRGTGQPKSISRHGNYGLHAKLYVFDRRSLFVGSMNFDQRSKRLNTEVGLIIESTEMAATSANRFESLTGLKNAYSVALSGQEGDRRRHFVWKTEHDGRIMEFSSEPARSEWQRIKMKLLSWLPLDNEL